MQFFKEKEVTDRSSPLVGRVSTRSDGTLAITAATHKGKQNPDIVYYKSDRCFIMAAVKRDSLTNDTFNRLINKLLYNQITVGPLDKQIISP